MNVTKGSIDDILLFEKVNSSDAVPSTLAVNLSYKPKVAKHSRVNVLCDRDCNGRWKNCTKTKEEIYPLRVSSSSSSSFREAVKVLCSVLG